MLQCQNSSCYCSCYSVEASQVIQSYGSSLSANGIFFLGAHFVWAFSLMFLFSGIATTWAFFLTRIIAVG